MTRNHKSISFAVSLITILSLMLSLAAPAPASASPAAQDGDGLSRDFNSETGKVTLISPSGNGPMAATKALGVTALSQIPNGDVAMALAERFAPEFGLQSASQNLKEIRVAQADGGRKAVRYQQTYQGVPVLAGELIVNTDDRGNLYSINGEVSPNLSLSTTPTITSKQAQDTALAVVAKGNQKSPSDFKVSDATLMIFDESLLKPSGRAPELVWKMEVTLADGGEPINELVLVNAQDGKVSLHFNQIDTAFTAKAAGQDPDPTPTPTPTDPPPAEPPADTPPIDNPTPTPMPDTQSQDSEVGTLGTPVNRYVSTTGSDTGDCRTSSSPCLTIQYALNQDTDGNDTIYVATGTYIRGVGNAINSNPNVVIINKAETLSGGWNSDFTSQTGASTIDGEYGVAGTNKNNNGLLIDGKQVIIAVTIDRFIIQNSHSADSGGIYLLVANLTLTNSTLRNNHASGRGAGIFVYTVGSLTLTNSTISANTATSYGGGIYNASGGAITIQNSTIAYNSASTGGGIVPSGSTVVRNTILANNTVLGGGPDCYGTMGTSDHNIFSSISGCTRLSSSSDQTINPQIDGSLTGTPPVHALQTGSPAIDAGTSTGCPSVDEQGKNRPFSGNPNQTPVCDIGAYEYYPQPGVPVTAAIYNGDNQQKPVNQAFDNPLAVLVADGSGDPVSGANVTFTAPASGAGGSFAGTSTQAETVATNASGIATSSVFTANGTVGAYSVAITVSGVSSTPSFSLANTGIPGQPYSVEVYAGSGQYTIVNQAFDARLEAIVKDYLGTVVAGANVTFTAPSSLASGSFAGTDTQTETAATNALGIATSSTFTANNTVGFYSVTVSVSGVSSSPAFSLRNIGTPGEPYSIDVYAGNGQAAVINQAFDVPLKVIVRDFYGMAVTGVNVTFNAPNSGASGVFTGTGTNNSEMVVTDSSGVATASTFTANGIPGSFVVLASASGVASPASLGLVNMSAVVMTYTASNSSGLPGSLMCDQTQPSCTGGADPDADNAHKYAMGVLDFYRSKFGRVSIDGNDMPVVSTVHYQSGYDNAFWDGAQMVYGDARTFAQADDVVAHELTHGVTQYESNLMYFYQSGAINESLSDVFAEYYDQANGLGNDSASVKWLLGEDISPGGAIRSMSNPPLYGDPDRMKSSYYDFDTGFTDNGGVHTNSGINNKAAFLMVDGGSFNGKTIAKLGWDKVGAIYYEAQTNLLTPASDYSDLYYALYQACQNLAVSNSHGVTLADCQQVRNATDAVQMNVVPVAAPVPTAPLCPTGMNTGASQSLFRDDFENGTGNWNTSGYWSLSPDYITTSGIYAMWGNDDPIYSTSILAMKNDVYLPVGSTPFLHFRQTHAFDYWSSYNFDGGVLEYSTNGGSTWKDAKPLYSAGENYNGTIFKYPPGYEYLGSSLQGRPGFVRVTNWYSASRYDLKSLAGQNVRFRWVFATDSDVWFGGWLIDDVRIYMCSGTPSIPSLVVPASGALTTNYMPLLDWSNSTPALARYEVQVSTNNTFSAIVQSADDVISSQYVFPTPLLPNITYYWRVRSFNALDQTRGWSAVRSFRTALLPPALSLPADTDHVLTSRPSFTWNPVPGATGYTIQISKFQNFSTLLTSGTPATASFVPGVNLLINSTLYWRVQSRGTNGPSAWSSVRSFTTANPPSAPVLASPATNTLIKTYPPALPLLKWNKSTLPTGPSFAYYRVQVANDAAFTSPIIDDTSITNINTVQFSSATALNPNTTYFWRVGAYNTASPQQEYSWSSVFTFRTILAPPVLNPPTPNDGTNPLTLRPTFTWSPIAGASKYTIQISKFNNFSTVLISGTPTTASFTPTTNLPANTPLFWRVQALGTNGPSLWSALGSFTSPNPPNPPGLLSPAAGALVSTTPTLTWSAPTLPTPAHHYKVQIAINNNFSTIVQEMDNVVSPSYVVSPALTPGVYYWRVIVYNSSGQFSISASRSFKAQ